MPIGLDQTSNFEVISTNRCLVYLPQTPGGDGKALTLRHGALQLPGVTVGQITVKLGGYTVNFAGRREQEPTFTLEFTETVDGIATRTLVSWQNAIAGFSSAKGIAKSEYAKTAQCQIFDTIGKASLIFELINIWPAQIQLPEFGEDSSAYKLQVTFAVDSLLLVGATSKSNTLYSNNPEAIASVIQRSSTQFVSSNLGNKNSGLILGSKYSSMAQATDAVNSIAYSGLA